MKLKDVGFFQRHIEKLVLGAAGVFALAIAGVYMLGDPFTVEINNRRIEPGEVMVEVNRARERLQAALNDEQAIGVNGEVPEVPDISGTFLAELERRLDPFAMPPIGGGPMPLDAWQPLEDPSEPYYVPRPQMPKNVVARAGYNALADYPGHLTDRQYDQVLELIGRPDPADFRYVSVGGQFNLDDWRERLAEKPEGAEGRQIRAIWWRQMVHVAGVHIQRQAQDPVTGEWGEPEFIDPLPHQVAFASDERVDWRDPLDSVRSAFRQQQDHIQRTPFVPVKGQRWRPPHQVPAPLDASDLRSIQRLERSISRARSRIESWERQLPRLSGDQARALRDRIDRTYQDLARDRRELNELLGLEVEPRPEDRRAQERMPARPGGPGGWMPSDGQGREPAGGRRPTRGSGGPPDYMMDRRNSPTDAAVRASLPGGGGHQNPRSHDQPDWLREMQQQEPGGWEDGRGWQTDPRLRQDPRRAQEEEEDREDIVRVWAHDLTVQPGGVYRYRLVVTVLNPLYLQDRVPDNQHEQYYNVIALGPDEQTLAETEWTDPVRIDPELYFFLVGGSAEDEVAEVEMWRIHDGAWRRGELRVRPGDPIAGTVEIDADDRSFELDMRAEAVLIDLVSEVTGTPSPGSGEMRMLYYDAADGTMADRMTGQDSQSIDRLRLESELTVQRLSREARAGSTR